MEETRAHVPAGERLMRVETMLSALRDDVERLGDKVDRLTDAHQQRSGFDAMTARIYKTVETIVAGIIGAVAYWWFSHK